MTRYEEYDTQAPKGWPHGPIRMRHDLTTGATEIVTPGFKEWLDEQKRAKRERTLRKSNEPPKWSVPVENGESFKTVH